MKFYLEIEVENDAMQSLSEVADALVDVASKLRGIEEEDEEVEMEDIEGASIMDENGNTVGSWWFE